MPSEGSVQDRMIAWLRSRGATYIKTHGSSMRSGEPDLIAALPPYGFMLCVEVKKPGGVASVQQLVRVAQWRRAGAIALVCENLDELKGYVDEQLDHRIATIRGNGKN